MLDRNNRNANWGVDARLFRPSRGNSLQARQSRFVQTVGDDFSVFGSVFVCEAYSASASHEERISRIFAVSSHDRIGYGAVSFFQLQRIRVDKILVIYYDYQPDWIDRHLSEESIDDLVESGESDQHLLMCANCTKRVVEAQEFDRVIRQALQSRSLKLKSRTR